MITTKQLTINRHDIFTLSGKYIGDATRGFDGNFRWHPFISIHASIDAATLHAIANFLDSISQESTKPSNANPSTATD